MGKKYSGFIEICSKIISGCKSDRSKLLKSVVSLALASVILVTCTFCWYFLKSSEAIGNDFTLDAGKGLRVNDTGTSQFNSDENDYRLLPASSVDGRNLFFPTDGTDFSSVTKDMTFRSANVGDKNVNYIQIDFDVTAQANLTSIYIDPDKTSLEVYDKENDPNANDASAQQAAPLRMAIWASAPDREGHAMTPVVFNSQAKTVNTAAVSEVDRGSGAYISNAPQVAHQFSEYAIGGKPITTLSAGKKTYFSVIIWLEGCDPKCTVDYISKIEKYDIKLKLAFKTSWDNTEVVRFKDDTSNEWIKSCIANDGYTLTVRYEDYDTHDKVDFNTYKYRNAVDEWTASVPSDMKNKVYFILSPPANAADSTIYTFCKSDGQDGGTAGTSDTYNRGVNRQYVTSMAKASADSNPTQCQGHWTAIGDSDGGGVDIGDLDGDDF